MTRLNLHILLAACGLLTAVWHQASRADDLLRLVDGNAAACLHVQGLKQSIKTVEHSEFAKRVRAAEFYSKWLKSPEYRHLLGAGAMVTAVTGSSVRNTIEALFGREFVVSLHVSSGAAPTGTLILKMDEATIQKLLTIWDGTDKQTRTEIDHNGTPYFSSRSANNQQLPPMFYVVLDEVFAISNDESRIRQAIDFSKDEATVPADSLARNADFEPATWRRDKTEVMAVYLNPRAFDSFVSADGDVPSFARSAWKQCRWLTFRSLFEKDQLQFQMNADYDSQASPDWWTRWVRLQAERKLPLSQVPSSALLTMSGHVATTSIRDLLKSATGNEDALSQNIRQVRRVLAGLLLGADPLDDLLPMLGPRWLFYSVPRKPAESAAFPLDGLITIDLKLNGTEAEKSRTKAGLQNALKSGLNALAAIHNAKTKGELSVLREEAASDTTVFWAEPVTSFRPAFAVTNRNLVLATDPKICEAFIAKGAKAFADRTARENPPALADNNQLILASPAEARKLLETHSAWFIRKAGRDNVDEDEAKERLAKLKDTLSIIDSAWFSVSGDSDTLTATIGASVKSESSPTRSLLPSGERGQRD